MSLNYLLTPSYLEHCVEVSYFTGVCVWYYSKSSAYTMATANCIDVVPASPIYKIWCVRTQVSFYHDTGILLKIFIKFCSSVSHI